MSAVDVFKAFAPVALVGTLADVPDLGASTFVIAFYREFSEGSSVGAAMRIARHKMLLGELEKPYGRLNNPFGLLFTTYLGEDTHVRTQEDRRPRFVPNELQAIHESPLS